MVDFTKEIATRATTASEKVSKVVTNVQNTASAQASAALDQLKKAVISGAPSFDAAGLSIPGLDFSAANFNSLPQSQKDLPLASGYDSGQTKVSPAPDFKPPIPNLLEQYATVNTIFTLSVLDDEAINFPDATYRKGMLGEIILKSASGAPDSKLVGSVYGKFDFFMDDLKISSTVGLNNATGLSNATNIEFKIIEPYSMGMFFQVMQLAAYKNGDANYTQVPVLLTIEWKGWTDLNQEVPILVRQIPLKLREITLNVSGRGSEYTVSAYPWNEQGFSKTYNEVKTDIGIQCDKGKYTIQNLLQTGQDSLQAVLNRRLKKLKADGVVEIPDEILILFPLDTTSDPSTQSGYSREEADSATISPGSTASADAFYGKLGVSQGANETKIQSDTGSVNLIGQAPLGFNENVKGQTPFGKDVDSYDKATGIVKIGSVTIDLNNSKYHFAQGGLISDIITNVILNSDYGRSALDQKQQTPDGFINWIRIESQVFNIPRTDNIKGAKSKCVVYRVVNYKVHASRFLAANAAAPGLDNLKKQALKEYNYIYTGKNVDVLDFAISFQAGFYTSMFTNPKNTENKVIEEKTSQSTNEAAEVPTIEQTKQNVLRAITGGGSGRPPENPTQVRNDKISSTTAKQGGAGYDTPEVQVARQFQDVITNQVDMINLNMTILGDPYYIADSGMGNYSAKEVQGYDNLTGDGSMNYQNGEVVITVNFRTPIDINLGEGTWDFRATEPVAQFSGLFRVLNVESMFSKNKFTQELQLVRLPGQEATKVEVINPTPVKNQGSELPSVTTPSYGDIVEQSKIGIFSNPVYGGASTNNVNSSPPNPGLPGVINTGGFTI
jgi:hypothetical protein